jgi:cytochrome c peroxidase
MASFARTFLRASRRAAPTLRQSSRRSYSAAPPKSSNSGLYLGLAALAAGGGGYYLYTQGQLGPLNNISARPTLFKPTQEDYQKVYNDVAELLENNDYDDGSYGPVSFPFLSLSLPPPPLL